MERASLRPNLESNIKVSFYSRRKSAIGETSTIIKFNNEKCLAYTNEEYDKISGKSVWDKREDNCKFERSLYCYENYIATKVVYNHYLYEYTFTEEDYKRATKEACEKTE